MHVEALRHQHARNEERPREGVISQKSAIERARGFKGNWQQRTAQCGPACRSSTPPAVHAAVKRVASLARRRSRRAEPPPAPAPALPGTPPPAPSPPPPSSKCQASIMLQPLLSLSDWLVCGAERETQQRARGSLSSTGWFGLWMYACGGRAPC